MKAGCIGSCRQGRDACTMPGTCHRPTVYATRHPWWHYTGNRAVVLVAVVWVLVNLIAGYLERSP